MICAGSTDLRRENVFAQSFPTKVKYYFFFSSFSYSVFYDFYIYFLPLFLLFLSPNLESTHNSYDHYVLSLSVSLAALDLHTCRSLAFSPLCLNWVLALTFPFWDREQPSLPKMDRRGCRPTVNSPGSTVGWRGLTSQAVPQSGSYALDPKVGVGSFPADLESHLSFCSPGPFALPPLPHDLARNSFFGRAGSLALVRSLSLLPTPPSRFPY